MESDSEEEQQKIITLYIEIFIKWVQDQYSAQPNSHKLANPSLITSQYFHKNIVTRIYKQTKLHISFDNVAGEAIQLILKRNVNFQLWCNCDVKQERYFQTNKRVQILKRITSFLLDVDFIGRRKFQVVKRALQEDIFLQKRVIMLLECIKREHSINKKMKLWKKYIVLDFVQFWTQFIHKISAHTHNKQLISLYEIYKENIFQIKQTKHIPNSFLQNPSSQIPKFDPFDQISSFLYQRVSHINLFHPSNKHILDRFQQRYEEYARIITDQFYPEAVFCQTYGSYRSKFCLIDSDIDVTVFYKSENQPDRSFNVSVLKRIQKVFRKKQNRIRYLYHARVPLLTVSFKEEDNLKGLDFVANNQHGVKNSQMLEMFSRDVSVQNLCILAKKWAKNNNLIEIWRFSSYGIIYMTLYYLISTSAITPLPSPITYLHYSSQVQRPLNLYTQFLKFLQFYSKDGQFFCCNQVVCLLQNCTDHSHLIKDKLLINIHDFVDGSNPGRFSLKQQQYFFGVIQNSKRQLMDADQQERDFDGVLQLFGL